MSDDSIRPFRVNVPDEDLAELRRRIAATRWPHRELVDDRSQGVQLATVQELARYWEHDYDWSRCEAKLNALPQFLTEIDGVDVHFIHVQSPHDNALPLIMTHGWPGSVIELLETIGPLTDPTKHGGRTEDAFHLVLPSIPGYGFSGEPTELGWWAGRAAAAWPVLMQRLGYTRYVAQGGDVGAAITDAMGRLAPPGLLAIHTNLLAPGLGPAPRPTNTDEEKAAAARGRRVQGNRVRLLPRAGHAPADDRLRVARFTGRARRLDARPRHRQLREDHARVRRQGTFRQPHPRSHPRQHHAVLADGHRHIGSPVVLGERPGPRPRQLRPVRRRRRSRSRSASRSSPAKSFVHRAPGSRPSTRTSSTSTRRRRADTSPPGKNHNSSPKKCEPRSRQCAST